MNDLDKQEFKTQMIGLGETYGKEISKSLLKIYRQSLECYPIEDIIMGISRHLVCQKHGGFFPKPADIIRNIEVNKPSCDLKANSAWLQITKTMSSVGAYGSLQLEDKQAIMAVKMLGSWRDLCHTDLNKLDFNGAYNSLLIEQLHPRISDTVGNLLGVFVLEQRVDFVFAQDDRLTGN